MPASLHGPEKWRHLSPFGPGKAVDELVCFVDFAPTLISLAGTGAIPPSMQAGRFSDHFAEKRPTATWCISRRTVLMNCPARRTPPISSARPGGRRGGRHGKTTCSLRIEAASALSGGREKGRIEEQLVRELEASNSGALTLAILSELGRMNALDRILDAWVEKCRQADDRADSYPGRLARQLRNQRRKGNK